MKAGLICLTDDLLWVWAAMDYTYCRRDSVLLVDCRFEQPQLSLIETGSLVKVVEFRYFGGLSVTEKAEVLKISSDTVTRDWNQAKAWLHRVLNSTLEHES